MLVTMGAIGLYTNIMHSEGMALIKTELNKKEASLLCRRQAQTLPNEAPPIG